VAADLNGDGKRDLVIANQGQVFSQRPKFGAVLPGGGKVSLVVSRGRKR